MTKLLKRSFVNDMGETIEPGDRVICVAHSTQRVRVYRGVFVGLHVDDNFDETQPIERNTPVSYAVREYPGERSVKDGTQSSYTYCGNTYYYDNYVNVEDLEYNIRRTLYCGRIYKAA